MTSAGDSFQADEADYADDSERRLYRETRGYPKNARPFSARQTLHRLDDLRALAVRCQHVVARGHDAFIADDDEGELLRAASERYVIAVGNIVEKLHSDFKDRFPDVPWRAITAMRNLVAHHYDKVDEEVVWHVLEHRVPQLLVSLDVPLNPDADLTLPQGLAEVEHRTPTDPFPAAEPGRP